MSNSLLSIKKQLTITSSPLFPVFIFPGGAQSRAAPPEEEEDLTFVLGETEEDFNFGLDLCPNDLYARMEDDIEEAP